MGVAIVGGFPVEWQQEISPWLGLPPDGTAAECCTLPPTSLELPVAALKRPILKRSLFSFSFCTALHVTDSNCND
eukprot:317046-Amphidinium_carterae.1